MNDFTLEEEMKIDDNHWMNVTITICGSITWATLMIGLLHVVGIV